MTNQTTERNIEALKVLHDAGARLLKIQPGVKRPLPAESGFTGPDFRREWPDLAAHVQSGGKLGFVPSSLGLIAVDLDVNKSGQAKGSGKPTQDVLAELRELAEPVAESKTPSGGYHIFFRAAGTGRRNGFWRDGETRSGNGYVVLYDPEKLASGWSLDLGGVLDVAKLPEARTPPANGEGNRNNRLYTRAFAAALRGDQAGIKSAESAAAAAGLPDAEIKRTVRSATEAAAKKQVPFDDEGFPNPVFAARADLTARPIIAKSAEGLHDALTALGVRCRYNLRSAAIEFLGLPENPLGFPTEWTASTDRAQDRISDEIRARYVFFSPKGPKPAIFGRRSGLTESLNALVHQLETDPFEEYLRSLEPRPSQLLDSWLNDLFFLKDTTDNFRLAQWASRFMFLGAVQRTLSPACKLDEVPVLVGAQGVGKSSVCRAVLPRQFQDSGFTDTLKLSDTNQKIAEALQGRIVVECSEMTGVSRAELEHLKSALTRTDDSVRLSYRHDPEPLPRRCVIIGTANNDCLPGDATGNRRFVTIEIEGDRARHPVEAWLDDHKEELWSAALYEYRQGQRANLPRELVQAQTAANDARRKGDLIVEDAVAVLTNFADRTGNGQTIKTLSDEIATKIGLDDASRRTDRQFQMRLAEALRLFGWTRRRTNGKSVWFPPH